MWYWFSNYRSTSLADGLLLEVPLFTFGVNIWTCLSLVEQVHTLHYYKQCEGCFRLCILDVCITSTAGGCYPIILKRIFKIFVLRKISFLRHYFFNSFSYFHLANGDPNIISSICLLLIGCCIFVVYLTDT